MISAMSVSDVYPIDVGVVAEIRVTPAEARVLGHTRITPPPPGVSTSLVMFCVLGSLLGVVLVLRVEAFLQGWS